MSNQINRKELLEQLRRAGVQTVTAEYSGFHDFFQVNDPEAEPVDLPDDMTKAVQDLFYGLLNELYPGWHVDEGSFGHFTWNVIADRIDLDHTTMEQSTEERVL